MTPQRLLLADDHRLVLDGICKLLENEPFTLHTVEDGRAVLAAAEQLRPDIILLDISMPHLNGIDAARRLKKIVPGAKIIFLTMHADQEYVREAIRAGASGYLLKRSAASELLTALREVSQGKSFISPQVTGALLDALERPQPKKRKHTLTQRQREVLQLVAEGHSNKEIADILDLSVKTVEYHKASLMKGLSLRSTAELTLYAIRHGLIDAST